MAFGGKLSKLVKNGAWKSAALLYWAGRDGMECASELVAKAIQSPLVCTKPSMMATLISTYIHTQASRGGDESAALSMYSNVVYSSL